MIGQRTRHAQRLFDGIAQRYDTPAEVFSFGQYGRWRRALVRALNVPREARVLDVATGTGGIARAVRRRYGCAVLGLDQSFGMLAAAAARGEGPLVAAQAERLPFSDDAFDAVVFSYLLRYVDDPASTMSELTRVLRRGGTLASVEFGLPPARTARALWRTYARAVFAPTSRLVSSGWREVGGFLPRSIEAWAAEWPVERQLEMWRDAGIEPRARRLSLGAGVVMWGRKR